MDEVTIKDVKDLKKFLDETKDADVKTLLGELKTITSKEVETFLETDEGKKILLPKLDSHFDKALVTWKENNLDKEFETKLADEIAIRYPEETEIEKRLKAVEKDNKEKDKRILTGELKNQVITFLNEAKLPLDITEYLIGEDKPKTLEILGKFKTMMEAFQKTLTDEWFKKHGREITAGAVEPTPIETLEKLYAEAIEKGDLVATVKLKNEIFKQKQEAKQSGG